MSEYSELDLMFEVFEYARISDGIVKAEGLARKTQREAMHIQADKIRKIFRAAIPEVKAGLPLAQEPKYTVDGSHIINRHSGEAVPHDEPVFVFRARDALGVRALEAYLALIGEREPSSLHADAVRGRIADFKQFAQAYPDRMKWPDTAAPIAPEVKAEPFKWPAFMDPKGGTEPDIVVTDTGQAWDYATNKDVKGTYYKEVSKADSTEAPKDALTQKALAWIEEALTYVGSTSWSPSMVREGRDILAAHGGKK